MKYCRAGLKSHMKYCRARLKSLMKYCRARLKSHMKYCRAYYLILDCLVNKTMSQLSHVNIMVNKYTYTGTNLVFDLTDFKDRSLLFENKLKHKRGYNFNVKFLMVSYFNFL